MKKTFLLLVFFTFIFSLFSVSQVKAIEFRGFLDNLARDFYKKANYEEILSELINQEEQFKKGEEYLEIVALAEIEIFRGEIKSTVGISGPDKHFEKAFDLAKKALELNETAKANRLAAEALSHLFNYRNIFFIIRNGGRALEYLERALELGEDLDMTLFVQANYLINAPSIGGGDLEKGIKIFDDLLSKGHPVYNFLIYHIKADLAEKGKENGSPEEFLQKAKEIYPGSPLLGKLIK